MTIPNTPLVKSDPTSRKPKKRYRPGVYTRTQAGSSGVRKEQEAAYVTVTANVLGFSPSASAVLTAIGSITRAAAWFDIGCVRATVMTKNPASTAAGPYWPVPFTIKLARY